MGIFGKVLNALGFEKEEESSPPAKGGAPTQQSSGVVSSQQDRQRKLAQSRRVKAKAADMPVVDVVGRLEQLAQKNPQELDWKVSIVDLLKLLGIDSSYDARKELAVELGAPPDTIEDSARMNTWLHKTVLQKIADNGGNIPRDLLN